MVAPDEDVLSTGANMRRPMISRTDPRITPVVAKALASLISTLHSELVPALILFVKST